MAAPMFGPAARLAIIANRDPPPVPDEQVHMHTLRQKLGPHASGERLLYHLRSARGKVHWAVNSYFREVLAVPAVNSARMDYEPKPQPILTPPSPPPAIPTPTNHPSTSATATPPLHPDALPPSLAQLPSQEHTLMQSRPSCSPPAASAGFGCAASPLFAPVACSASQASESQDLGSKVLGINFSGGQALGSELSGSQVSGSQVSGSGVLRSQLPGSQALAGRFLGSNMPFSQASGSQFSGHQVSGNQILGSEFSGSQSPASRSQFSGSPVPASQAPQPMLQHATPLDNPLKSEAAPIHMDPVASPGDCRGVVAQVPRRMGEGPSSVRSPDSDVSHAGQLPGSLVEEVMKHLDLHSLCSAAIVCRTFKTAAASNDIWRRMYAQRWGAYIFPLQPSATNTNNGSSTANNGNSTANIGNSTANNGNSTANNGNSTANNGNSTANNGNSTANNGSGSSSNGNSNASRSSNDGNSTANNAGSSSKDGNSTANNAGSSTATTNANNSSNGTSSQTSSQLPTAQQPTSDEPPASTATPPADPHCDQGRANIAQYAVSIATGPPTNLATYSVLVDAIPGQSLSDPPQHIDVPPQHADVPPQHADVPPQHMSAPPQRVSVPTSDSIQPFETMDRIVPSCTSSLQLVFPSDAAQSFSFPLPPLPTTPNVTPSDPTQTPSLQLPPPHAPPTHPTSILPLNPPPSLLDPTQPLLRNPLHATPSHPTQPLPLDPSSHPSNPSSMSMPSITPPQTPSHPPVPTPHPSSTPALLHDWRTTYKTQYLFARHMQCPKCGTHKIVPIVYGFPSIALLVGRKTKRLILGGDHLIQNCHVWACTGCNAGFRYFPFEDVSLWVTDDAEEAKTAVTTNADQPTPYTYEL